MKKLKNAYNNFSKIFHPDVKNGDKFFEDKVKEIQQAYEFLLVPENKNKLDNCLRSNNRKRAFKNSVE